MTAITTAMSRDKSKEKTKHQKNACGSNEDADCETWCIKNFNSNKQEVFHYSPKFYSGMYNELEWKLYVSSVPDNYVRIAVQPMVDNRTFKADVRAVLQIVVLNNHRAVHQDKLMLHLNNLLLAKKSTLREITVISRNDLHDGDLIVNCSVMVTYQAYSSQKIQFLSGLDPFHRCEKYSDVTLVAKDGIEIPAHKFVLAGRSPVFEAMFEHDLKEKKTSVVNITDFERIILEDFLLFLYEGKSMFLHKTPFEWAAASRLLQIADKYQVLCLKEFCVKHLALNLSVENVCNILKLADLHSVSGLKKSAIAFFNENRSSCILTQGWTDLLDTSSGRLIGEIMVSHIKNAEPLIEI